MGRLIVIIAGMLGVLSAGVPAWGQGGTLTATLGPPLMPATPAKPLVDVLYINGVRIQAVVTNLAAIMPRETPQAAAVRKDTAEVAAINAAINAAGLIILLKLIPLPSGERAAVRAESRSGEARAEIVRVP